MELPGFDKIEDCMDTFKLMPETILKFLGDFKNQTKQKGNEAYGILKFIGAVILFICVFPALPFFFVMAVMIASMKYILLKFSNL